MLEKPAFIQGMFAVTGQGLATAVPLTPRATYRVPGDKRAQTIYFRAGNAAPELVAFMLTRQGTTMRIFPVGARSGTHVPLAVLEDLSPDSEIEILAAAPQGLTVTVVLDVGFMEVS